MKKVVVNVLENRCFGGCDFGGEFSREIWYDRGVFLKGFWIEISGFGRLLF